MCIRDRHSTVRDLLPRPQDLDELPVVDVDATSLEVAAVMARMHSPVVAVVDDHDGGIRVIGAGQGGCDPVDAFGGNQDIGGSERIHRVAAALSGAAAMVLL